MVTGDNYWSHPTSMSATSTFTKGGALASTQASITGWATGDHHLNYSYQSIAHNIITVTDPQDRVASRPHPGNRQRRWPAPRRLGVGGQSAPTSVGEWQKQRETYETATLIGRRNWASS
jgi:hypothetical protein